jgi:hypothetical protein
MKQRYKLSLKSFASFTCVILICASCKKNLDSVVTAPNVFATVGTANFNGHLKQTKIYSSEVVLKWLDLQNRVLMLPQEQTAPVEFLISRFYSAIGIALYESVVPGMPAYQSLSGQLLEMPQMPSTVPGLAYHWPTSANAAIAHIYRTFLPNRSTINSILIDSLENALNATYATEEDTSTLRRSVAFGTSVAIAVGNWINTDGTYDIYPAYVPPSGPGLWVPTPPSFTSARGVHWGDLRTYIPGVLNANTSPAPIPFSTQTGTAFYNSMNDVYQTKQLLLSSPELRAQVSYWRGTPGGSGFILWYNILRKVLAEQGSQAMLDKAAIAYCKMGIAQKDAVVSAFKAKYQYNQLAPITYIRNILGYTTWSAVVSTPSNPCYPELHSPQYTASSAVLSNMIGSNHSLNTSGINELPGYIFNSFEEANDHACESRFYAGVGTRNSINAGKWIGNKTVEYMLHTIRFLKE